MVSGETGISSKRLRWPMRPRLDDVMAARCRRKPSGSKGGSCSGAAEAVELPGQVMLLDGCSNRTLVPEQDRALDPVNDCS